MFKHQVDALNNILTTPETEDNWDKIAKAINSLEDLFTNGTCEDPVEGQIVMRTYGRSLINAMNSERTRLSGPAISLVSATASVLGTDFEPLLNLYLPPLLTICGRTSKVVTTRARSCILAIVENTQLPTILPHLVHNVQDKSATLRLVVAETTLACLNSLNPPDLEKEARATDIEVIIRSTARDANADIRKVGKQIFAAYKQVLPSRVDRFTAPLTPTIRKYLDLNAKSARPRSRSPSRSRPPSSRSMHSTHDQHVELGPSAATKEKVRVTKGESSAKMHQRSVSTQPSTSKATEHAGLSKSGPSRLKADKTTMPPPNFIPNHAAPGAGRQMFAAKSTSSLDRHPTAGVSGPARPDPRPATSKPVVAGPFRPEKPTTLKVTEPIITTAAERHAMPNGPRRIILPEPEVQDESKLRTDLTKKPNALDSAVSTSSAIAKSVPTVKAAQPVAPLKRTVSRPQLTTTKAQEKFKPVGMVRKAPSSSSTTAAKGTMGPPPATTAPPTSKPIFTNVKGKGLNAPTLAQASRMKPPIEKKTSVPSSKPTWGSRPASKNPAPGAKSAAPPKSGTSVTQRRAAAKINPASVPLPPSPKRGAAKGKEKRPAVETETSRANTPALVPLPPSPLSEPTPDADFALSAASPLIDDDPLQVEEEEVVVGEGRAEVGLVIRSSTPTPLPSDILGDDIPGDLQIILTGTSPCSDAPSSASPSTPQATQKNSTIMNERTPISALLASIQEGFLFTPGPPISPPASIVARVKAAQMDMSATLGDRRDSWAETRHILGLDEDEVPFGISSVFSKRSRSREALSNVEVNQ